MYAAASPPPPNTAAAESYSQQVPTQFVASFEPEKVERPIFLFRRWVLPIEGGKVLLRLTQPLQVAVNPRTMECEVLGWDVRMPVGTVEEIPKALARRFLQLFSKADAEQLDEKDRGYWMNILDQVDFPAFTVDRAAPHYVEGTLRRAGPPCMVDWHDGEREKIDPHVARALGCLTSGDDFGAYVKLGMDNRALSIERVVLL